MPRAEPLTLFILVRRPQGLARVGFMNPHVQRLQAPPPLREPGHSQWGSSPIPTLAVALRGIWRGIIPHPTTPGVTVPFDAGVGVVGAGVAVCDDMGVAVAGTVGSAFGVDPGVTGVGVAAGDDMGVAVGDGLGVVVAGTVGSAFGVDPGFGFDPGITGVGVAVGVQVGLGVGVAVPAGPGVAGQVFGVNVPTTPDIDRFGAAGIAIEDALKAR